MAFGGGPVAVGGFVLRHDHEGLLGVDGLFDLVEGDGGDDVVAVAGVALHLPSICLRSGL